MGVRDARTSRYRAVAALAISLIGLAVTAGNCLAQTPGQIQYTYDAAGNLIDLARVSKPDLTVSNLVVGTITVLTGGAYSIPVTFTVNNVGNVPATGTWTDRGYLSSNAAFEDSDEILGGFTTRSTAVAAGSSYNVSATYTTAATTAAGTYTLFVKADGGAGSGQFSPTGSNNVDEFKETNNVQSVVVSLPTKFPDLTVSGASIGAITVNQTGAYVIPLTYTVNNVGGAATAATFFGLTYLSVDGVLDDSDQNLSGYALRSTAVSAGSSYAVSQSYTTNAATASGNYTLVIKADGHGPTFGTGTNTDNGNIAESSETNNTQALAISLPTKPDLVVSGAVVGAITVNQAGAYLIPVNFTVANIGGSAAQPNFFSLAYLSADGTLDNADQNLSGYALRNTALGAGANYAATATYTTTAATAPGNYTLFVKADGHGPAFGTGTNTDSGNVAESSEANNAQALSLTLPAKPDLAISGVSVGSIIKNANNSYSIPVTLTVTNVGGLSAPSPWYDLAYLSANASLDDTDQNLTGYNFRNAALGVGANYTVTKTYTTTTTTPAGTYTLFVKTDGRGTTAGAGTNTDAGALAEAGEANNIASVTVVLP